MTRYVFPVFQSRETCSLRETESSAALASCRVPCLSLTATGAGVALQTGQYLQFDQSDIAWHSPATIFPG